MLPPACLGDDVDGEAEGGVDADDGGATSLPVFPPPPPPRTPPVDGGDDFDVEAPLLLLLLLPDWAFGADVDCGLVDSVGESVL